mgnify:CR=1 FL=1
MARPNAFRFFAALVCVVAAALAASAAPGDEVALNEIARRYGLTASWSKARREYQLCSRWTTLVFTVGSREAEWNGFRLFLGESVVLRKDRLQLAMSDWLAIVRPLLDPAAVPAPGPLGLVVIDPGHGSPDPGTENRALGLQEKNVTLDVAHRLRKDLQSRGYRVLLTRETDAKLRPVQLEDLQYRAEKANRAGADLFISLHFNSLPGYPKISGIETYALTPAGQRSTAAARRAAADAAALPGNQQDHWNMVLTGALHRALIGQLGAADRGLKHARFAVLRTVRCPAALIEAGFLSSPAEARRIKDPAYRQEIAEAIGDGIRDYDTRLRLAARRVE